MSPASSLSSTPVTPSRTANSLTMSGATASRSQEVRWDPRACSWDGQAERHSCQSPYGQQAQGHLSAFNMTFQETKSEMVVAPHWVILHFGKGSILTMLSIFIYKNGCVETFATSFSRPLWDSWCEKYYTNVRRSYFPLSHEFCLIIIVCL